MPAEYEQIKEYRNSTQAGCAKYPIPDFHQICEVFVYTNVVPDTPPEMIKVKPWSMGDVPDGCSIYWTTVNGANIAFLPTPMGTYQFLVRYLPPRVSL